MSRDFKLTKYQIDNQITLLDGVISYLDNVPLSKNEVIEERVTRAMSHARHSKEELRILRRIIDQ